MAGSNFPHVSSSDLPLWAVKHLQQLVLELSHPTSKRVRPFRAQMDMFDGTRKSLR